MTSESRCPQCEAVMDLLDECYECTLLTNVVMTNKKIPSKRQTLTHCKDGHALTDENVYVRKRPERGGKTSRICKTCRLEMERKNRRLKAAL